MLAPNPKTKKRPIAVLGAGDLVSHVFRLAEDGEFQEYRFNIFRLSEGLEATHQLRPCDLRDLVKLYQVLTFAIADDGWSDTETHKTLLDLNEQLDALT